MRELSDHKVNLANDALRIEVMDEPGAGGASHRYVVTGMDMSINPSLAAFEDTSACIILFQNGVIDERGMNGITNEALLAIVADRLRSFAAGPYPSRENSLALTKVEEALHWLHARTRNRQMRNVEGKEAP